MTAKSGKQALLPKLFLAATWMLWGEESLQEEEKKSLFTQVKVINWCFRLKGECPILAYPILSYPVTPKFCLCTTDDLFRSFLHNFLSLAVLITSLSLKWVHSPIFSSCLLWPLRSPASFYNAMQDGLQGQKILWFGLTNLLFASWQWKAGHHVGWWLGWSFAKLPHLWYVGCCFSSQCFISSSAALL